MIHFVIPFFFFLFLFLALTIPWHYIQISYDDNSLFSLKQKVVFAILLNTLSLTLLIPLTPSLHGMFYEINLATEKEQFQVIGVTTAFFFGFIVPVISMGITKKRAT